MRLPKVAACIALTMILPGTLPGNADDRIALSIGDGQYTNIMPAGGAMGAASVSPPITDPVNDPAERAWHAAASAAPPFDDKTIVVYSTWVKFCGKGDDSSTRQICLTGNEGRTETGQTVVTAALIELEGETRKLFRVTLPSPLHLQYGTRIIIDRHPAISGKFFTCLADSCFADYEASPELIGKLKKGKTLVIQAINLAAKSISFSVPLAGNADPKANSFAEADESPSLDPSAFEAQQKKLADKLRWRIEVVR